jgi:hypothetical protein
VEGVLIESDEIDSPRGEEGGSGSLPGWSIPEFPIPDLTREGMDLARLSMWDKFKNLVSDYIDVGVNLLGDAFEGLGMRQKQLPFLQLNCFSVF